MPRAKVRAQPSLLLPLLPPPLHILLSFPPPDGWKKIWKDVTLGKWEAEQEEVVSALFFTVADNWKPKISSLEPPTVPHLFEVLGKEFINNDALMGLAKRKELTEFKFSVERRVHEQFTKFEEIYKICVEYGMKLSDTNLAWTLLNCLSDGYNKKFQSKLKTIPDATLSRILPFRGLRGLVLGIPPKTPFQRNSHPSTSK